MGYANSGCAAVRIIPRFYKGMKRRTITAIAFLAMATVIIFVVWPRLMVDRVIKDFFRNDAQRTEDMTMDPLILNADLVKYRVLEEIKNPAMEKRRYAIHFLGIARFSEALPTLREILLDETEKDYFRADALESIYRISMKEGRLMAERYGPREGYLGHIGKGLLDGSHRPTERTYTQAINGHHE